MFNICSHNFEIIETHRFEKVYTSSEMLKMSEVAYGDYKRTTLLEINKNDRRGIISVYKCSKCGKVKHIKTTI